MNSRLSFLSLWSINDALNLNALKKQLDELRLAGLEGVIFHPLFYPNVPVYMSNDYLEIVSDLILYAKATGMIFWIYDENGWPSGTASGEVIRRLPDATCKWVEWVPTPDHGGRIVFGSETAVSSLDPVTTQMFLGITYEGYRQGLSPEAFDYVTGFFSDEVAFLDGHGITVKTGAIPWDDRFVQQYEERYGEALLPRLPLLFTEGEGLNLPKDLAAGSYVLAVALYPSTFNVYGPHHHYEGDRYLTSPDQYAGIKNFADHPGAPEQTRVQHAHFVKWGISGDVQFV